MAIFCINSAFEIFFLYSIVSNDLIHIMFSCKTYAGYLDKLRQMNFRSVILRNSGKCRKSFSMRKSMMPDISHGMMKLFAISATMLKLRIKFVCRSFRIGMLVISSESLDWVKDSLQSSWQASIAIGFFKFLYFFVRMNNRCDCFCYIETKCSECGSQPILRMLRKIRHLWAEKITRWS